MAVKDPYVTCDNKDLLPLEVLLSAVIHKDAAGCANQVVNFLCGLMSAKRERGATG